MSPLSAQNSAAVVPPHIITLSKARGDILIHHVDLVGHQSNKVAAIESV